MASKIGVALITALGLFFLVLIVHRGVLFMMQPDWAARGIGAGVVVVALVGAWVSGRELLFGFQSQRLGRRLEAEGGLPVDDLPRSPGGRIDRAVADEQFGAYRAETEAAPESWRAWYRLALAYDASGDRRRAREAARRAISLERADAS
ncbi:hypothetical protein [Falsarthrobacter nasiphocae]|uniref:Tetratricopeptide repeat protein n=1 Tax=Falsarthrobacter nasiphocae TaxID=189863 RepID=A0AAE3YGC2_9MICC|nr:hypothetical protein [Falsarthrobacter nasiphocae]MDR6892665.1 hypothetical protein [Falsarthrobacter nasiphocae]